jgi:hypothetical protein
MAGEILFVEYENLVEVMPLKEFLASTDEGMEDGGLSDKKEKCEKTIGGRATVWDGMWVKTTESCTENG